MCELCDLCERAVDAWNVLTDIECEMMEVINERAFDPFDEQLSIEVHEFVLNSFDAVSDEHLSARTKSARLKMRWLEFVENHKKGETR